MMWIAAFALSGGYGTILYACLKDGNSLIKSIGQYFGGIALCCLAAVIVVLHVVGFGLDLFLGRLIF